MKVELFSDGACSGNPGPGGYGVILRAMGKEKEISGFEPETTNNRMELRGVIEGLRALKYPCDVIVTTDSRYVCDGINNGWAKSWKAKGWKKSDGKPASNTDLWDELLKLVGIHNVSFKWVRGHNSHPENERCDRLAVAAITKS
ncbi:MAG: ribonuclease HI [Ruminococcus sp.]|nr:ribonuclease HI [Ruminococcus sp.]